MLSQVLLFKIASSFLYERIYKFSYITVSNSVIKSSQLWDAAVCAAVQHIGIEVKVFTIINGAYILQFQMILSKTN